MTNPTLGQRVDKVLSVWFWARLIDEVKEVHPADLDIDDGQLRAMLKHAEHDIQQRQRLLAALRDVQAQRLGGF